MPPSPWPSPRPPSPKTNVDSSPPLLVSWLDLSRFLLCLGKKLNAHRLRHFRDYFRRLQFAALLVNAEDNDAVRILVGDEQELAGRVDIEVSRRLDLLALMPHRLQLAAIRIDGKYCDAVMPAVRAVHELAGRMHNHFRGVADAFESIGQR